MFLCSLYTFRLEARSDSDSLSFVKPQVVVLKKEFIGPGLHLRPTYADHARLPLQWTLNSLFSACGKDNGRIRPPPDRGILKLSSRLLIA